jgi:hypothetical protein
VEEERAYVAAEMMAFLVAWLASLNHIVLNRPSPLNLAGPGWCPERWLREARGVGLPVHTAIRSICSYSTSKTVLPSTPEEPRASDPVTITICADECVFDEKIDLDRRTEIGLRQLAAKAQVGLMTATFLRVEGRLTLYGATPRADVSDARTADALLSHFQKAT